MTNKFYTAKYDRVFKTIFCKEDDPSLLKEFLSRVLEKKIEKLSFLRNELEVENVEERVKTVDIFALVDGEYTHIEINTGAGEALHTRNFIYFTSLYNKKTTRGEEFDTKSKFLHLDFTYGLGNTRGIKTEYYVEAKDGTKYINNFKIIEYNMDRIMQFWYDKKEEEIKKYKHFIMLDLATNALKKLAKGDEFMESFEKEVTKLNDDEAFQSFMTIEEDRKMMFNTEKALAYEEGETRKMEEIAKKMLQEKIEIPLIMKCTGLTEDEIEPLL